jgi:hypothetical protein
VAGLPQGKRPLKLVVFKLLLESKGMNWIESAKAVVPKVWGAPPWGGARGAKLFYSLKINKKNKYHYKNLSITRWSFK